MRLGRLLIGLVAVASAMMMSVTAAAAAPAHPAAPAGPATPARPATSGARAVTGHTLYAFDSGLVLSVAQTAGRSSRVRIRADASRTGQQWLLRASGTISPVSNPRLCLNMVRPRRSAPRLEMWPCDRATGERFIRSAPSAHTPVFFVSPRAAATLCVTAQTTDGIFGIQVRSSRVVLSRCANTDNQAWSTTNLATTVGQFVPDFSDYLAASGTGQPGAVADILPTANLLGEEWTLSENVGGMTMSPIEDVTSCLTARAPGQQLALTACNGGSAQEIVPVLLHATEQLNTYLLAADNGSYCILQGTSAKRHAVLRACPDTAAPLTPGAWYTQAALLNFDNLPRVSGQFESFYSDPYQESDLYGMTASGTASGSAVVLADNNYASQIWTDIRPGSLQSGNPDGSISIRPLNDLSVCLTVPGGDYAAGVSLQVQTCDGAADQEFSAVIPDIQGNSGPAQFRPYAATSLCITPLSGVTGGSPVGLEDCDTQQVFDQPDLWEGLGGWATWVVPSP